MAKSNKAKKHMTREEEFDILKLVLDKFLWLGVIIMGFGLYRLLTAAQGFWDSILLMGVGIVILLLFAWLLIREYNFMK